MLEPIIQKQAKDARRQLELIKQLQYQIKQLQKQISDGQKTIRNQRKHEKFRGKK